MTSFDDAGFVSLLTTRAAAEPERVYARFCGEPVTYAEIEHRSAAFAWYLRTRGIVAGDRVAVMMRNSIATIAVVFGLARAGVAWVPVNAQQRGEGLRYLLTHSQPRLVVADAELAPQIAEAMGQEAELPLLAHADQEQQREREEGQADRALHEDREIAFRQEQRPTDVLFHHRAEHIAQHQRGRRAFELGQDIAEHADRRAEIDVDRAVVEAVITERAEHHDRREQPAIGDAEQAHPEADKRQVQRDEQGVADEHAWR